MVRLVQVSLRVDPDRERFRVIIFVTNDRTENAVVANGDGSGIEDTPTLFTSSVAPPGIVIVRVVLPEATTANSVDQPFNVTGNVGPTISPVPLMDPADVPLSVTE
jgi:hypothetical protein